MENMFNSVLLKHITTVTPKKDNIFVILRFDFDSASCIILHI